MKKRSLLGLLACIPMLWLSGCGGGSGNDANIRVVNASAGYSALDLYADDSQVLSSVAFGAASDYVGLDSGTIALDLTSAGSTTYLLSQSRSLSAETSYTMVTYGWEGALKATTVSDDVEAADSSKTKVSVLNTATDAGSLDVYLTAESDALDASTPVASSVAGGSQSSYASIASGTYRLRVTAAGDTSDLRLDQSGVVLSSTGVVTFVMTPTTGGVLVNGLQIVQGSTVTKLMNTQARVRAVAAVADTAKVALSAGGTSLLANAPSPTIGSYTLVTAGSVSVTGTVNGTALATSTQTLAAGSDVTWLVNGAAASPSLVAITDDNRLPVNTSKLKLRLVNAMNGMSDYPLTLAVDYTAVASDVAQASASSYGQLVGSTTAQLDVSSALSAASLYTLSDLTLSAQGVYTVFMFGTSTTATGALRKER
jgi:hypothetical protein